MNCSCISHIETKALEEFERTHPNDLPMYTSTHRYYQTIRIPVIVEYGISRWWTKILKRKNKTYYFDAKICPFCGKEV